MLKIVALTILVSTIIAILNDLFIIKFVNNSRESAEIKKVWYQYFSKLQKFLHGTNIKKVKK